jgi:hypothetical protein
LIQILIANAPLPKPISQPHYISQKRFCMENKADTLSIMKLSLLFNLCEKEVEKLCKHFKFLMMRFFWDTLYVARCAYLDIQTQRPGGPKRTFYKYNSNSWVQFLCTGGLSKFLFGCLFICQTVGRSVCPPVLLLINPSVCSSVCPSGTSLKVSLSWQLVAE